MFEKLLDTIGKRLPEPLAVKLGSFSSKIGSDSAGGKSARTAVLVFFVRIISAILAFALQVFLARWMGSEQYGVFVLVWVVAVMMGAMSCLGLQTAVIRFITEYRARNDILNLNGILLAAPGIVVLVSTLIAAILFVILLLFGDQITDMALLPLYLALACLPFLALEEIQEGISRSFDMPLTAIGPAFVIRPAGILVTMAFAYLLGFPANAVTALASAAIATFFSTILQSFVLWTKVARLHGIRFPIFNSVRLLAGNRSDLNFQYRYWLSISLPIFMAGGFFILLFNSDVIIIGLMLDPEAVAIYYAALKCLAFVHFVQFAFRAASTHHFSRFYSDNDIQGLADYANKIARWTFWPTFLFALVMVLSGKYILMLFGTEFVEGQELLVILAAGIVLRSSIGPIDTLLAMTGQQNTAMWVLAVTLLSNIILNVSLIPIYGLWGAAIATSSAMLIETAAMYIAVNRKLGISIFALSYGDKNVDEGYVA